MGLTKEQILGINDIAVKEIQVPKWNGTLFIRQLSRGQQDAYLKRQFGKMGLKQQGRTQGIESNVELFGHDAWLFAQGVCDENGQRLFADKDVVALEEKNGEVIGFVASKIVEFSGMGSDVKELEETKNS